MASSSKPATFTGNSPLAPLMAQFIQEKRACGYRYNVGAWALRRLDAHVDVKTTQIYARANLEMKRRALEKVAGESPSAALPSWQQSKSLLDWLRSL